MSGAESTVPTTALQLHPTFIFRKPFTGIHSVSNAPLILSKKVGLVCEMA
jgi:hypothetical protein